MKASWSLTGLLVLGWTLPAAAQPTAHLSLTWSAPPGCPTQEDVETRVDALLGGQSSASSVADVRASGQVERAGTGFRLLLGMSAGEAPSSRVIEAGSCDELAGAAAIAIALLARSALAGAESSRDPSSTPASSAASGAESRPSAQPPQAPQTDSPAARPHQPFRYPARSGQVHFVIDAPVGAVVWGSLPSLGMGIGGAVGLRWRSLRAVIGGELWKHQSIQVSGFGARFALQSGRAEACFIDALGDVELGACAGATLERLVGEGVGSPTFAAKSREASWLAGMGSLFGSVPMPGFARLRFFGQIGALVSAARPRFVIDQLGPVHEPALAAPKLDLGCEWIF